MYQIFRSKILTENKCIYNIHFNNCISMLSYFWEVTYTFQGFEPPKQENETRNKKMKQENERRNKKMKQENETRNKKMKQETRK